MVALSQKAPSAAFRSSFVGQRTKKYASLLSLSRALHLALFDQPAIMRFFNCLL
jgi:hypothetical protein